MKNRNLLWMLLLIIAVIAMLHIIGNTFYLYWQIPWYDRVIHALGGFWVSFALLSVFQEKWNLSGTLLVCLALLIALIFGLAWEAFELSAGITVLSDKGYGSDTLGDLISDLVGGIVAGIWSFRYKKSITSL